MKTILGDKPEVPDPCQINLFDFCTDKSEPDRSMLSEVCSQTIDVMIRSPTCEQPVEPKNGKNLNFNQKVLASSLHRKSRELVKKSIEILNEE